MSIGVVASIILSLVVAWYVLSPLLEPAFNQFGGQGSEGIDALTDRKDRALRSIKDLELDFEMGKLSREDFDRSKAALSLEAAALLEEISTKVGS
jgi:hypothetical protein